MDAIAFLGYYNILLLYILPLTKLCNSIIIILKKKQISKERVVMQFWSELNFNPCSQILSFKLCGQGIQGLHLLEGNENTGPGNIFFLLSNLWDQPLHYSIKKTLSISLTLKKVSTAS